MNSIEKLMEGAVAQGIFPSAVLACGDTETLRYLQAFGNAVIDPPTPARTETVYDLASLTKPLATAASLMLLVQDGALGLDQPLGEIVSRFSRSDKAHITVRQLLGHTSGLPDWRPYYESLMRVPLERRRAELCELLANEPLVYRPKEQTLYSDVGFLVLQEVVEETAGSPLDEIFETRICRPLGISSLFFRRLSESGAVEDGRQRDTGAGFAATEICPWRNRLLIGEVHDDNAHLLGGVAGHAGLFGTARDAWLLVAELCRSFAGKPGKGLFNPNVVKAFFTVKPGPGSFVLGFDTPSRPGSSSGRYFSDLSVGHLGFTGVSFWADLEKKAIVILLSNRVHPARSREGIKHFRPVIHDAAMERFFL
ncbi:MAG: serine hydrolase domain-containing protein [Thermodesulfobacteriota bacterium]